MSKGLNKPGSARLPRPLRVDYIGLFIKIVNDKIYFNTMGMFFFEHAERVFTPSILSPNV